MADLNDLQAAQTVKIVGADATGTETNPLQTTSSGAVYANFRDSSGTEIGTESNPLKIDSSVINTNWIYGQISLSTTPAELKVGAGTLSNRKIVTIDNTYNGIIYWGTDNLVSSSNFAGRIFKDQQGTWEIGDQITIYVVLNAGSGSAKCSEGA